MTEPQTEAVHDLIAALPESAIVAITIWAEARAEAIEGRIAVANVIRNRVQAKRRAWGTTYRDICLAPWQFSCWTPKGGAVNYARVMDTVRLLTDAGSRKRSPVLVECLWIADGLIDAKFGDNVHAATHYYSPAAMHMPGAVPKWADGLEPVAVIGAHRFYAGVR